MYNEEEDEDAGWTLDEDYEEEEFLPGGEVGEEEDVDEDELLDESTLANPLGEFGVGQVSKNDLDDYNKLTSKE